MGVRACQLHGALACAALLGEYIEGGCYRRWGWSGLRSLPCALVGHKPGALLAVSSRTVLGRIPLLSVMPLRETVKPFERRSTATRPSASLLMFYGHRLNLRCAGSGTPRRSRIEVGRNGRLLGMDFDGARTRHEGMRVRSREAVVGVDPASVAQDGVAVTTDLRTLVDRAHVPGPFVFVGHSGRRRLQGCFPTSREAFEGLPAYPAFYSAFRRIPALLPSLARLGVGRLVPDIQRLHHASPRCHTLPAPRFPLSPSLSHTLYGFRTLATRPWAS